LVVGASKPNKCWPVSFFARLIELLRAHGLGEPVLLGGPGEREPADQIQAALSAPALDAVGSTSLPQLAALLARCTAVVSGDTGALHMAVALDRPVVGLYGPTSPALTGPYGSQHRVLWSSRPCSPCNRRPTCEDFGCMTDLTPPQVLASLAEVLPSSTPPREVFS
jgi:ADP-heptose:LPS heptosyltransferase